MGLGMELGASALGRGAGSRGGGSNIMGASWLCGGSGVLHCNESWRGMLSEMQTWMHST